MKLPTPAYFATAGRGTFRPPTPFPKECCEGSKGVQIVRTLPSFNVHSGHPFEKIFLLPKKILDKIKKTVILMSKVQYIKLYSFYTCLQITKHFSFYTGLQVIKQISS
jgi:hypothetical protein